ncbi:TRAP transporter substrate-binding protein [Ramlibacter sp. 2FC]|uniref:TRAP transporter substrate-binding protein n=1 Tax=Ramlibacter sp. 2FC TaxID=2502188 RepID=UPI0010F8E224|nr:TRAP transporter substrate-binding protein [Ramlibacter sp. 2FC]
MKRRGMIKAATAASLASVAAAPAIAQSQPNIRWRLASSYPKTLDTIYAAAETVANRVSAATGGKFEIRVHAAGEIVPAFQVIDAVQQGSVECGHAGALLMFGKDPTFALDASIPFGMNSRQMSSWMVDGGGLALLRDFYREFNIVNFPCGNTGTQMGGFFRKEIKSVEDIKGLKFRIGGFGGTVIERLGGVPQNIPPGDIYPALEKGTIDAAEFIGPYDDERLGLHKVVKNYYYPGFWEGGSQVTFFAGAKAYESLPKEYQTILAAACYEAHVEMQAKYDARNPAALKRLVAGGAKLRPFPRPVLEAAWKAANELYAELSAKNAHWRKIYESYAKFRDDSILWARFSEGSFDSFMSAIKR